MNSAVVVVHCHAPDDCKICKAKAQAARRAVREDLAARIADVERHYKAAAEAAVASGAIHPPVFFSANRGKAPTKPGTWATECKNIAGFIANHCKASGLNESSKKAACLYIAIRRACALEEAVAVGRRFDSASLDPSMPYKAAGAVVSRKRRRKRAYNRTKFRQLWLRRFSRMGLLDMGRGWFSLRPIFSYDSREVWHQLMPNDLQSHRQNMKICRSNGKKKAFREGASEPRRPEKQVSKVRTNWHRQARVGGRFMQQANPPLGVSPPLAPTAFVEKEKKENESRLSAAQPTTHCVRERTDGPSTPLPPEHPARVAARRYRAEQRRAARRTAACEVGGSGHVTPPAMPSFAATVATSRTAAPSAAPLTAWPNTPEDELVDDESVPDEHLLSPATLETNASMAAMFRPSHRRTSRLIALKRIREGKPAWETLEEASANDRPTQRLSEAEARGFRAGGKSAEQSTSADAALPPALTPDAVAPLTLTPQPDDHLPADPTWLRWQLGSAPELARLAFRPEARGRYSRAVWRAAVGKLISRYRFQVQAPVPYLVAAAAEMAKPGCHDNRKSKFYSVANGWSPSLRKFAMVEARAPGWMRAYGGRDDWY